MYSVVDRVAMRLQACGPGDAMANTLLRMRGRVSDEEWLLEVVHGLIAARDEARAAMVRERWAVPLVVKTWLGNEEVGQ